VLVVRHSYTWVQEVGALGGRKVEIKFPIGWAKLLVLYNVHFKDIFVFILVTVRFVIIIIMSLLLLLTTPV